MAMPPDNLHRLATWPRLPAPVDARSVALAAHGVLRVGKLCICLCDTIRSIRSFRRRDTATFGRLAGRCRDLDSQPGNRVWCARLSRRAQHVPLGFRYWHGGADRDGGIEGGTAAAMDRSPYR